jgi:hypothetical protein
VAKLRLLLLAVCASGACSEEPGCSELLEGSYEVTYTDFSRDCLSGQEINLPTRFEAASTERIQSVVGSLATEYRLDQDGCAVRIQIDRVDASVAKQIRITGEHLVSDARGLRGEVTLEVSAIEKDEDRVWISPSEAEEAPRTPLCEATAQVSILPARPPLGGAAMRVAFFELDGALAPAR